MSIVCAAPFTAEYVASLVRYDPDTGKLFWKPRTGGRSKQALSFWNRHRSGKEAFTTKFQGYRTGFIDSRPLRAHRVAWVVYYGEWPDGLLDHINRDRADNRINNLRIVDQATNARNSSRAVTNKSGVTGVFLYRNSRWRAQIWADGTNQFLGYFPTIEEAAAARKAAERRYGFGEAHGSPPVALAQ